MLLQAEWSLQFTNALEFRIVKIMSVLEELQTLESDIASRIQAVVNASDLEDMKSSVFGKKGKFSQVMKGLGKVSADERPILGQKLALEVLRGPVHRTMVNELARARAASL